MIQDILTVTTLLEYQNAPKNIKITDPTDYVSEGIALADVVGILKITGPAGVVYENAGFATDDFSAPDIDLDVSNEFSGANLPLDANGDVQLGPYTVQYKISVVVGAGTNEFSVTISYTNAYEADDVEIEYELDCRCSQLISKDVTSLNSNLTSVVRTHTLRPPAFSNLPDSVSPNANITRTPITDKTWATQIVLVVDYTFSDGLQVSDQITGSDEMPVVCDVSLCDLFCCIKSLFDDYVSLLASNQHEALRIKNTKLDLVLAYMSLYDKAFTCGMDSVAQAYYDKIMDITGCEPGCNCGDDDTPTLIIPICGAGAAAGSTVVAVCGNGAIELVTQVVGTVTTYTLCFNQTLLNRLNALFNTTLIAGTNMTIGTAIAANGDIQYTLNAAGADVDIYTALVKLELNPGNLPTLTVLDEYIIGTEFQAATHENENDANYATWSANPLNFSISDYLVNTGTDHKPNIESIKTCNNGADCGSPWLLPKYVQEELTESVDTGSGKTNYRWVGYGASISMMTGLQLENIVAEITYQITILR